MSLKIESPRPLQVSRPEVRPQVAPSIAKGEPAPSAAPRISDRFERATPGTGIRTSGSSRFEGIGLPKRLESSKALADNVVKFFSQDAKLQELGRTDPIKAREILKAAFQTDGLSARDARHLSHYAASQLKGALGQTKNYDSSPGKVGDMSSGGTISPDMQEAEPLGIKTIGTTRPSDAFAAADALVNEADVTQFKNWGDVNKFANDALDKLGAQEGLSKQELKAYLDLKLGERLVNEGIDLGGKGGKIGLGKDDFQGIPKEGSAPSEPLEDLPRQLEPHRGALEKLTDSLLRDSKLDNDAKLRKALWTELKKLPLQNDAARREARQYLLEEMSLRQDRYTE